MAKPKKHQKPAKHYKPSKSTKPTAARPIAARHVQTFIPGTEPADVPSVVRDAVHKWLDDCDEGRQVSRRRKMSHDLMIAQMLEHGIERAPYTDSISGKKKHVYADRTPKAKTINAPRPGKSGKRDKRDRDHDRPAIDAEIADPNANKVEARRVSREGVEAEISEAEAKVRAADNAGPKIVRGDGDPDGYVGGDDGDDPFARVRGLMATEVTDNVAPETEH